MHVLPGMGKIRSITASSKRHEWRCKIPKWPDRSAAAAAAAGKRRRGPRGRGSSPRAARRIGRLWRRSGARKMGNRSLSDDDGDDHIRQPTRDLALARGRVALLRCRVGFHEKSNALNTQSWNGWFVGRFVGFWRISHDWGNEIRPMNGFEECQLTTTHLIHFCTIISFYLSSRVGVAKGRTLKRRTWHGNEGRKVHHRLIRMPRRPSVRPSVRPRPRPSAALESLDASGLRSPERE